MVVVVPASDLPPTFSPNPLSNLFEPSRTILNLRQRTSLGNFNPADWGRAKWYYFWQFWIYVKEPLSGILTRQIWVERNGSFSARGNARHRIAGLRRGNARHRLKHVATRLPPAGPHTNIQCLNRRRQNNRSNRQRRREDTANDPNS
jgi:hypothetical protein